MSGVDDPDIFSLADDPSDEAEPDAPPAPRRRRVTTEAGAEELESAPTVRPEIKTDWGYVPGQHASEEVQDQLSARRNRFGEPWRRDPGRELALLVMGLIALVTIFGMSVSFKTARFSNSGLAPDSTYWMESAQRFRYAQMAARGDELPDPDVRMQAPDGYPPHSDTIFQELLYGRLFAATQLPEEALPAFIRLLTRLVASSSVVPIALLVLALTRRRDAALIAALAFGGALLVSDRGNGQVLYREDLAFPVLCWHLAFTALWVRRNRLIYMGLAGVFLALSLLLWKVMTFYTLLLVGFLGTAHWLGRAPAKDLWPGAILLLAPAALASLLPYSLHHDQFSTSTPMLAGLAVILCMLGSLARPQMPSLAWAPVAALLLAALRFVLPEADGYDHAWETIAARLQHLGHKPLDPAELSFHARHYWTGNYQSPTSPMLARGWPWLGLATLPGFAALAAWWRPSFSARWEPPRFPTPLPIKLLERRGPMDPLLALSSHYTLWLVGSFLASYLIFRKLVLFGVLAAAVLIGVGFVSGRGVGLLRRAWIGLWVFVAVGQGFGIVPGVERVFFADRLDRIVEAASPTVTSPFTAMNDLAEHLPEHVGEDEPVLASFVLSPFILTYLERPTVLHCFFEGDLLPRYQAVTEARMAPEEQLWTLAQETGAVWYLHEAHQTLRTDPQMSQRYVSGEVGWPKDAVITAMSFAPETLKHFQLVWENDWFRLFRVLDEGRKPHGFRAAEPRPLFNRPLAKALFGDPLGGDVDGSPFRPEALLFNTLTGDRLFRSGRARRATEGVRARWAERDLQESLRIAPWRYEAHAELADIYRQQGKSDRASRHAQKAVAWRAALLGARPMPDFDAPDPVPVRDQ